jgi:capsid protein
VQLHAIASGIGVPYEALTGDLTGVNFTSGRMGWLEFQRNIGSWQGNMFVPQVCQGVWQWFADAAELSGIAGARGATVSWNPPAREMIDPTKEIPAIRDKIRAGLSSLTTEQRRQGVNPEDLQQEIIDDNKRLDDNEIVLDSDARVMSRAGALHPAPTETETEAPAAPAEGEE